MGFSVSGSAAIIFVGVIVAAGIAVPPIVGSFGELSSSQSQQIDRGVDALNTDISIESAIYYDDGSDELELELENTGSTSLAVADTSLLVDGEIPDSGDVTTAVDGDSSAQLWRPGERLTITVSGVTQVPERMKVVTENGIAETTTEIEQQP